MDSNTENNIMCEPDTNYFGQFNTQRIVEPTKSCVYVRSTQTAYAYIQIYIYSLRNYIIFT